MNYRHLFHAGNFADVLKHALLLAALADLTAQPGPLEVLDTHAGAGLYDLDEEAARRSGGRSGEASAGVGRLMADPAPPPALAALKSAVAALNPDGRLRWYPGSPRLALPALRAGDGWTGCELRGEEAAALRQALAAARPATPGVRVVVREGDGYAAAIASAPAAQRLVLIDPPFERGDEGERIAAAVAALLRRPGVAIAVWLPLKDLDGFDRLLSRIEALRPPPSLAVQARLRPLDDPMRMNGAALLLLGLSQLEPAARETADWVARTCGGVGARGVVEAFGA